MGAEMKKARQLNAGPGGRALQAGKSSARLGRFGGILEAEQRARQRSSGHALKSIIVK